jgi:HEAT repeat protein
VTAGGDDAERARAEALALLASEDLDERCAGVRRLAELPGEPATGELVALLEESSWYLRDRVVEALAGRPGAGDALLAILREAAWFARASACDALGRRGEASAVPALVDQVADRNVSLQKSAIEALRRLAGDHGCEPVARAVARLDPPTRRRIVARIGHHAPHWAGDFERSYEGLPADAFRPEPEPAPGGPDRAPAAGPTLVRFRRWLASLPARREA